MVELLQQGGHEVIVASRGIHRSLAEDWIEYDLQRPETIGNIVALQPDGVFHLAWSTVPSSAEQSPSADLRINAAGSLELFRALGLAGARVLFLSSGGTVYGRTDQTPVSEDHPPNPIGMYGMGKLACEQYADLLRRMLSLDVRIARLSNPYGANISDGKAQGAASIFARRILAREEIVIMGDGNVIRDYIDVRDAATAISKLMTAEIDTALIPVFNIGSGEGASLTRIVSLIEEVSGEQAMVRRAPGRHYDVPYNVLDISKIATLTGWAPSVDLMTGLRSLITCLQMKD